MKMETVQLKATFDMQQYEIRNVLQDQLLEYNSTKSELLIQV